MENTFEKYVVGTCTQMCPETEIINREKEGLLHKLEILSGTENIKTPKADRKRAVKAFSRSAAGKEMPPENTIRPANILLETVSYLLHDVITVDYLQWNVVYDFIMDRLRAVRQDIVIQNLPKAHTISLLQPIIRFYAYASYRLCNEPIETFDPEINKKHLQECLKRLLILYDECDELERKYIEADGLMNVINEFSKLYYDTRSHFEAMYILFNVGDVDALTRALNLPKHWRTPLVEDALKLSLYYMKGNYVRVCRMLLKLPSLLAAVTVIHLPQLRRKVLQSMCVAYASKNLWFPIDLFKELFLYTNTSDLVEDCRNYNIPVYEEKNAIYFIKGCCDSKKSTMNFRHEAFIDEKLLQHSIPSLVLYGEL